MLALTIVNNFCSSHTYKLTQPCLLLSFAPTTHCCPLPYSHCYSATATLVHSFVASRLDYCSCLYTSNPATCLSCLDRVLRTAARLVPKYDQISSYMRDILHWLPARQRIEYRMAALVWRCLLGLAPTYLFEFCGLTLSARSSRPLRSAVLHVPFAGTSTVQKRGFAVAGHSIWNGLSLSICSLPRTFFQELFL